MCTISRFLPPLSAYRMVDFVLMSRSATACTEWLYLHDASIQPGGGRAIRLEQSIISPCFDLLAPLFGLADTHFTITLFGRLFPFASPIDAQLASCPDSSHSPPNPYPNELAHLKCVCIYLFFICLFALTVDSAQASAKTTAECLALTILPQSSLAHFRQCLCFGLKRKFLTKVH